MAYKAAVKIMTGIYGIKRYANWRDGGNKNIFSPGNPKNPSPNSPII